MSDQLVNTEDASVAITDPGERLRDEHYFIDRLVIGIGNVVAWIFPILMLAIVAQVVMRKMGHNQAWLDDGQWWLYGFAVITAFAYAITTDAHVRVDIFHQNFSDTKKAKLEIFAIGWLLLPFIGIMVDILAQYAWSSWTAREGSDSPNGLHRLYLLKISLPILLALACLAAISMVRRNLNKFTTVSAFKIVLAAFPFFLFLFDRVCYHAFYWFLRFSNPDLKPRKIAKEPLMEQTTVAALALLLIIIVGLWLFGRSRNRQ